MAGGMTGRGGLPMHERVRLSSAPPRDACPARHCWVSASVDGATERRAALLLEWRRAPEGELWQGRVVYLAQLRPPTWTLVEEWVDSPLLTPLDGG
jgi:hypothetical protein